ncbi:hypothetical protein A3F02_03660 [Candidatus Curtissbacteria bacterium RIFCSPHIGHO2_12_FULL_38_9b]|uniref:Nucleotidyl transferase AbiEii toxin, Type IV TA system n=2 Tax=Candidatus Curtissiibacteriota TaxID=1752717 RepID=A0A1F5GSX5_9BACT|nr:MAG: hypothetical protein A3F02_03660 [Candidatus Curtissbacteria bacterium RIFCSPHIGHO2_12_FULL_38_9b]OGD95127.1 MAG: hypothetical protein A3A48_00875 [Candidatus Curtissbacteria bacterium RIFCSPLOWO2_01_FULL_37_9]
MPVFYPDILNKKQVKVFAKLKFLEKLGFYMAGGTALALQINHRTSLDFDFYNPKHFSSPDLYEKIENTFKNQAVKISQKKDTVFCKVYDVDLSFFWYQYRLIEKPVLYQGILLASLEDIAAMKLVAVSHRPAKRDYIDIFYLLKKFTLKDLFSFANKKYPTFNSYYSQRALTYFEDIEDNNQRLIKVLDPDFSWQKTKDHIFTEVKKYQLSILKKR